MRVLKQAVVPDPARPPFFDGGEGDVSAVCYFLCPSCALRNEVDFWEFSLQNCAWQVRRPLEERAEIASLFGLQPSAEEPARWIPHGLDLSCVGEQPCKFCGATSLVYIAYDEASPLHYIATLQGVAQIAR